MMTVSQVAKRLTCSAALVYELCRSGKIPHYRFGGGRGTIRISEEQLQEYLKQAEVLGGSRIPDLRHMKLKHIRLPDR